MTARDIGPYETEQQARRAAFAVVPPRDDRSILSSDQNRQVLSQVLAETGVELSEFEARTVRWLGGWEDYIAGEVTGWLQRAHEAGRRSFLPGLLSGEHDYFVVMEALEEFAARQRDEATESPNEGHRREWAQAADRLRAGIDAALDAGEDAAAAEPPVRGDE